MGREIYCHAGKKINNTWVDLEIPLFEWRSKKIFSFLTDMNDDPRILPISESRGMPNDSPFFEECLEGSYYFSSWLSADELLNYDYEQKVKDKSITYKECLGEYFFKELEKLKEIKADRIVFAFD